MEIKIKIKIKIKRERSKLAPQLRGVVPAAGCKNGCGGMKSD
jgi:hypothetical protein